MTALTPTNLAPRADARRRAWTVAILGIAVILALLQPLFIRDIREAVRVWMDSTAYNHCFLIIPIVGYLIWTRRQALADVAPRPSPLGLAVILAGSLLWFLAAKLDVLEARQLLFMAIVQGLFLTLLGSTVYRRLLGPLLYLFFLVPSGEFLVPKLQDVTAHFAEFWLGLAGVPNYSDGTFIEIPEGTFVIAEACAGLRFLIAAIAYGALFGLLVYRSWWRRSAFLALSIIIPIIANGFRAFGIIYAAHFFGSAQAVEADHVLYGWMFFSIVIFLLTLVGMSFAERHSSSLARSATGFAAGGFARPARPRWYLLALAAVLAASGPVLLAATRGNSESLALAENSFPQPAAPWRALGAVPEWHPTATPAAGDLMTGFTDGESTVERYVALYAPGGDEDSPRRLGRDDDPRWERASSHNSVVRMGGLQAPVQVSEIRSGGRARLMWSFYIVDGRVVASPLEAKLFQTYASLTGRGHAVAFVALSTPVNATDDAAAAVLQRFLASLPGFDLYIAALR